MVNDHCLRARPKKQRIGLAGADDFLAAPNLNVMPGEVNHHAKLQTFGTRRAPVDIASGLQ